MLPAGVPKKHSIMEGWDPARGEKERQEACMVKGAGEGKEQNRWGEETE